MPFGVPWIRIQILICPITSYESLWFRRLPTPTARASSTPAIKVSYSDSLLEASKPKQTACSIFSPIGKVNCRPNPDCLEVPSMQRVHQPSLLGRVLGCGSSARKSAKTCPFLKSLGLYCIPYSLSSIAHQAIRPNRSDLWIVPRIGRSVSTTIGWAWK